MTLPASTQILNEIDIRLNRIKTKNGFSVNVKNVERSKRTKFTVSQKPGINYYSLNDTIEKLYGVANHNLAVSIEFVDFTMDEPFNDLAAKREVDIISALLQNSSGATSTALGGLVESVDIVGVTPIVDQKNNPDCGVIVDLIVKYKTAFFDHTTIL